MNLLNCLKFSMGRRDLFYLTLNLRWTVSALTITCGRCDSLPVLDLFLHRTGILGAPNFHVGSFSCWRNHMEEF